MDFSFNTQITKEELLKHYPEEVYLEHYIGHPVKKGVLYKSPFRNDKTPTCAYYKDSNGNIIFKDFSGDFYGNFITAAMRVYGCNYYQALKQIAIDFNIIKGASRKPVQQIETTKVSTFKDTGPAQIQITKQDFTKKELEWWGKYGITEQTLKKFQVYSCKYMFLNGEFFAKSGEHSMIFGYYGNKKKGFELWRIYFPLQKSYRFITNWPATKLQGYAQLPKQGKVLVITKSLKDVMALWSFKIPAIAPCSENLFVNENVLKDFKSRFKVVIVFYDNDIPGLVNMKKIKQKYPELLYVWLPKDLKCKDFSDLMAMYGRKQVSKFLGKWSKILLTKFKNQNKLEN